MNFEEKLLHARNYIKLRRLRKKCYEALESLEKWDRLMKEVNNEVREMVDK